MNYSLTDYINNKTNCKFNYLKLVGIVFDKTRNTYQVDIIYPQSIDNISDEDKTMITQYTREFLNLKADVEVKIRKSYIEENIILKFVKNFLENNYPSIALNLEKDAIKVIISEQVIIQIKCSSTIKQNFENKNLKQILISNLDNNFCARFEISLIEVEDEDYDEFLQSRLTELEYNNISNMFSSAQKRRYDVNITHKIMGETIDIMPQAIADFDKPSSSVIVAGRVKFLANKTYKSKRKPKNEGDEPELKPMFSFVLEDRTGKINAVSFPSKANFHKMGLIKDGDNVIIKGDIEKFGERLSLRVKSLSMCERIKVEDNANNEIAEAAHTNKVNAKYIYVSPKKYKIVFQENLFAVHNEVDEKFIGQDFVVFDLETTGLEPSTNEIIEIGAVKIRDGVVIETFTTFVKPQIAIPDEITKITNITNDMVANAPNIRQVLPDFYKFTRGATLVAYNIPFDYGFIKAASKKYGYDFDNPQIDALVVARDKVRGLGRYNLGAVCNYLGISLVGAHRALQDTIATAELFIKLY